MGKLPSLLDNIVNKEQDKRNSTIKIDQNIINFLKQINETNNLKGLPTLNEKRKDKSHISKDNSLNENIHNDFDRKNKARRSLLYLLNIKSKGTFCPQIIDYFEEIKTLKKKEEQLKEIKEENIGNSIRNQSKNYTDNINNNISKMKNQLLDNQTKINFNNYKFIKRNDKNINISEENNLLTKHYTQDYDLHEMDLYYNEDSRKDLNIKGNKFNYNKEAQAKKKFLEEYNIDNKDSGKSPHKKKKKKSWKKNYNSNINDKKDLNNSINTETNSNLPLKLNKNFSKLKTSFFYNK